MLKSLFLFYLFIIFYDKAKPSIYAGLRKLSTFLLLTGEYLDPPFSLTMKNLSTGHWSNMTFISIFRRVQLKIGSDDIFVGIYLQDVSCSLLEQMFLKPLYEQTRKENVTACHMQCHYYKCWNVLQLVSN